MKTKLKTLLAVAMIAGTTAYAQEAVQVTAGSQPQMSADEQSIIVNGEILKTNEDGFLLDPDQWNEDVARAFAKKQGIDTLTEDHWKVIDYIRGHYLENGIALMVLMRALPATQ